MSGAPLDTSVTANPDTIVVRVKETLIRALLLTDTTPDGIADDAPLFGDGSLQLDSVDAIELAIEIEREFGLRMPDGDEGREIYASVASIATHLRAAGAR